MCLSFSRPARVRSQLIDPDFLILLTVARAAASALNEAKVEVRIQFKDVTQGIFKDISRNELVLRIQPSEAVYLKLNTKTPGLYTRALPTEMDLTYKRRFSESKIPEAYEALILDALKGDHSNFVRDDELDVAWKVRASLPMFPSCFSSHALCVPVHRFSRPSCTGSTARAAPAPSPSRTRTARGVRKSSSRSSANTASSGRPRDSQCRAPFCSALARELTA